MDTKNLKRMTAKQLADHAFHMGIAEHKIYKFKGGPLKKELIIDAINTRNNEYRNTLGYEEDE